MVLSVKDNGIGISSEDQKIYSNVFIGRISPEQAREQVLVLAMVNEIAELHKGTISVNSILGEGSTFLFYHFKISSLNNKKEKAYSTFYCRYAFFFYKF